MWITPYVQGMYPMPQGRGFPEELVKYPNVSRGEAVITPSAKAGRLLLDALPALTTASCSTLETTTSTLCCKGTIRAPELLSGDTDVAASKPEQVRVCSLIVGSTFTHTPTVCNPAKSKYQRAACTMPVAIEASRPYVHRISKSVVV